MARWATAASALRRSSHNRSISFWDSGVTCLTNRPRQFHSMPLPLPPAASNPDEEKVSLSIPYPGIESWQRRLPLAVSHKYILPSIVVARVLPSGEKASALVPEGGNRKNFRF